MGFSARLIVVLCLQIALRAPLSAGHEGDDLIFIDHLKFSPNAQISQEDRKRFQSLKQLAELLPAYAPGADARAKYREPILTRGSRGITIFRQASPGVVLVTVGRVANGQFEPLGLGTGAVVDSRGYVLTNWHVINGYSNALLFFKPFGGAEPMDDLAFVGSVVAQDLAKDLALLRIINPSPALTVLPISNATVDVAEDVHVIGHPHGHFWSYSTGVVSQFRRSYDWSYIDGSKHRANVLQMQTAINPGNSGGPVLDDNGQIVGLVAMAEDGQNLNYAISADEIRSFLSLHLPARTRGTSVIAPQNPVPLSYSEAQDAESTKVLRAEAGETRIYIVPKGQSWDAFIQDGKSKLIHVKPKASDGAWEVVSPTRMIIELSDGLPSRVRTE
jgi:S1-C subfamily serine protease